MLLLGYVGNGKLSSLNFLAFEQQAVICVGQQGVVNVSRETFQNAQELAPRGTSMRQQEEALQITSENYLTEQLIIPILTCRT